MIVVGLGLGFAINCRLLRFASGGGRLLARVFGYGRLRLLSFVSGGRRVGLSLLSLRRLILGGDLGLLSRLSLLLDGLLGLRCGLGLGLVVGGDLGLLGGLGLLGDLLGDLGEDLLLAGLLLDLLDELGLGAGDDLGDLALVAVGVGEDLDLALRQRREDGDLVGLEAVQSLVGGKAAVGGAGDRGVRAAAAVGQHRQAVPVGLILALVLDLLVVLGELGLRLDVDPPAGEAGGEAGVLAVTADRQRELVVGDDHGRLALVVVDDHLADPRRRERLGDEAGGLVVVGNDVDLLAAELGYDHPHPGAAGADAGADRVDAVGVGDHRDLRAVAGLAGDADDLDQLVGDLRDLHLEQALDQLGAAAGDDDRGPFGRVGDVGDHGLDPHPVVVALVVDLLGLRQQGLDPLAQLDQRVALVGLLDDSGDQLADAVLVLLEHHHPFGLADPLQDHLLRGLGGDPAEVVGGDVAGRDLILVGGDHLRVELGVLELAELARLGVDLALLLFLGFGRLGQQLLLQLGRKDQFEDPEVAGLVVEVDAGVFGGAGGLLVGRQQGVREGVHQGVGSDPLLLLESLDCVDDLFTH